MKFISISVEYLELIQYSTTCRIISEVNFTVYYYTAHQGDWTSVAAYNRPIFYWQNNMGVVYQLVLSDRSIKKPGLSVILMYSLNGLKLVVLKQ